MAATNYFLSMKRGDKINPYAITAGTVTIGASADVELRMQINNGSADTGLTRLDVKQILEAMLAAVEGGVFPSTLPKL